MNVQLKRVFVLVLSLAVFTAACGSGGDGGDGGDGGPVTLSLLVGNDPATVALAHGLTEAFTESHPDITFDIEERPGGAEGDNVVKTRLATGEMNDVFIYNAGALLQALNPAQSVMDLTDDPMLDDVRDEFTETVTQNDRVYGVPFGTTFGGGILYNRQIYEDQGLSVPRTWDEFAANNDRLLDAGWQPPSRPGDRPRPRRRRRRQRRLPTPGRRSTPSSTPCWPTRGSPTETGSRSRCWRRSRPSPPACRSTATHPTHRPSPPRSVPHGTSWSRPCTRRRQRRTAPAGESPS
jgi:Bacterial extracellular solute-binding protein